MLKNKDILKRERERASKNPHIFKIPDWTDPIKHGFIMWTSYCITKEKCVDAVLFQTIYNNL